MMTTLPDNDDDENEDNGDNDNDEENNKNVPTLVEMKQEKNIKTKSEVQLQLSSSFIKINAEIKKRLFQYKIIHTLHIQIQTASSMVCILDPFVGKKY